MKEEDKIKILKWCGLRWYWNHNPDCHCGEIDDDDSERSWHDAKGHLATRFYNDDIDLDLNFYFKYAVPKLRYMSLFYDSKLLFLISLDGGGDLGVEVGEGKDVAEAFGSALLKLIGE
ncbi:hypothetical protein LCGC14_1735960 [marine sediment metagenome]|uniref:Uncharacterized protein n=1 Tax=marine sediment metagenome TaxID=412755 RepID=A0A0F9JNI9_9ZZZZ